MLEPESWQRYLDHLSYLWTTEKEKWVLVGNSRKRYGIIHIETTHDLIVEDDDLYDAVIQKMLASGNRILTFDEWVKKMARPGTFFPPQPEP